MIFFDIWRMVECFSSNFNTSALPPSIIVFADFFKVKKRSKIYGREGGSEREEIFIF